MPYTFHEHMPDTILRRMEAYRMLRNAAEHVLHKKPMLTPLGSSADACAYSMLLERAIDIKDSMDFHWSEYREGTLNRGMAR